MDGGAQLRLQGADMMHTIAVLPAVVDDIISARVCAWERRLSGPRLRDGSDAALEAILSGAVCAIAVSDLPRFNVVRCVLGEIRKCICVAFRGMAGERSAVVAQIPV